jgi:hypothetical protein
MVRVPRTEAPIPRLWYNNVILGDVNYFPITEYERHVSRLYREVEAYFLLKYDFVFTAYQRSSSYQRGKFQSQGRHFM